MYKNPVPFCLALTLLAATPLLAQRDRIVARIDESNRVQLRGHLHPKATPETDQGAVAPDFKLSRITLVLQPSASQKADLDQLLAQQQDPSSPNYHHWLTPEQYADRFGASQNDIAKISQWLQSQSLAVVDVARGRDWIAVSGAASSVQSAFGTEIHQYVVNGEVRFANASEPSIPAQLQGVITAIRGLNNFRLRPATRIRPRAAQPLYNSASLCGTHCIGPDDLAAIYNISPLFQANIDGSGQKIAIAGQTQIQLSDIQQYRSFFNLPAKDPQVILAQGSSDPGIQEGDLSEAELDIEMAGAVARNASIVYVYADPNNAGGVIQAAQYIIDQNLAPVLSLSYGDCEASYQASDITTLRQYAQKANSEGITWFSASGDNGATDCAGDTFPSATSLLSVDMPASLPEVTGVGGNEFSEGTGNTYWTASNSANNASALSYIPEIAWNDSAADGQPAASGGGASTLFAKPSWQTGTGVPSDNARDVPDLSLSGSADHDPYLLVTSDTTICASGRRGGSTCQAGIGGTSAGTPAFAGMAALLNQWLISKGVQSSPGLGNINPKLYSLAQSAPAAFHDVTSGNNIINVTCPVRQRSSCTAGPVGYNAGPGYDQVTGLGSVDAYALFTAWTGGNAHTTPPSAPVISAVGNSASYTGGVAPGMIVSVFGTQLASSTQIASSTPLPKQLAGVTVTINGVAAPLWYVSPTQLNIQVPFETPVNQSVPLQVTSNGQSAVASFTAAAAAPGIYTNANGAPVPNTSGSRSSGQFLTLFITGFGAVTPSIADGAGAVAGPLGLPKPVQNVTLTVGGVPANFAIGVPPGYAGIAQVNYQIPATAPLGQQPVVVTIGGVASKAATLTVTQ